MTRSVEPETYLRLAWERIVLSGESGRGSIDTSAVTAASRALVALGALGSDRAAAINEEYQDALRLRGGGVGHFFLPQLPPEQRTELSVRRIALCAVDFVAGTTPMTLTQVIFTDDAVALDLSGTEDAGPRPTVVWRTHVMGPGRQFGTPPHSQVLTVRDDAGTVASASISGSSSSGRGWEAHFKTDVPLAASTSWLEIDGARVDLPPSGPTPQVQIEPIANDRSLCSTLRREIINDLQMHGPNSLEVAITALVDTGALDAEDPLIEETRQISAAISGRQLISGIPEPWSSLLRRSAKNDGPIGRLPIGVAVVVDDTSIRFDSLCSEQHAFTLALAVSPGRALLQHGPRPRFDLSPIEWWAEDDRGNIYLLASGNGGGSERLAEGVVQSLTPLDPSASELRLLPTGQHERAIITISLTGLATG